ncbi:MAG: outer membrane lipid asymmetry maintenance protein MlaD [Gammaproteobacteria bacterium]|nr:outer membrane lipid asymmetry maintenance protein MlaD [Gammaproteobacteria bacterium]
MADNTHRGLEIGTGLFVLLGFAALAFLTTQLPSSGLKLSSQAEGYRVEARFDNVGDLKVGAPVTMAGVRVGRVDSVAFDSTDFKAVVGLRIERRYDRIPDDSDAAIQTAGLLGAKYVGLTPGGSETYLQEGGQIQLTQSALVLENLVNKMFATLAGKNNASTTEGK